MARYRVILRAAVALALLLPAARQANAQDTLIVDSSGARWRSGENGKPAVTVDPGIIDSLAPDRRPAAGRRQYRKPRRFLTLNIPQPEAPPAVAERLKAAAAPQPEAATEHPEPDTVLATKPKPEAAPAAERPEPAAAPATEPEPELAAIPPEPAAESKAEAPPTADRSEPAAAPATEPEPELAAIPPEPAAEPKPQAPPAAERSEQAAAPAAEPQPELAAIQPEPKPEALPTAQRPDPAAAPAAEPEPELAAKHPEPAAAPAAKAPVKAQTPPVRAGVSAPPAERKAAAVSAPPGRPATLPAQRQPTGKTDATPALQAFLDRAAGDRGPARGTARAESVRAKLPPPRPIQPRPSKPGAAEPDAQARFRLPPPAPSTDAPGSAAASPAPAGGLPPPPPATGASEAGILPPPAAPAAGAPETLRRELALDAPGLAAVAAPVKTGAHSETFFYEAGGAALGAEDRARLGSLAARLAGASGLTVEIRAWSGSAEGDGVEARRGALSRAMEVRRLLIAAGVPEARIVARAAGAGEEARAHVDVVLVGRS